MNLPRKGHIMDSRILDALEELYGEELTLVQPDLGQLEQAIGTILKSLGVGLLQRVVARGQGRLYLLGRPTVPASCVLSRRVLRLAAVWLVSLAGGLWPGLTRRGGGDLSGRWSRPGSSATLALRITWLNGEWDSFWRNHPMAA